MVLAEIISSTMKMEAICSSETSVETQQTTRHHIPENDTLLFIIVYKECVTRTNSYVKYPNFVISLQL
jgi:hypothetical protein